METHLSAAYPPCVQAFRCLYDDEQVISRVKIKTSTRGHDKFGPIDFSHRRYSGTGDQKSRKDSGAKMGFGAGEMTELVYEQ